MHVVRRCKCGYRLKLLNLLDRRQSPFLRKPLHGLYLGFVGKGLYPPSDFFLGFVDVGNVHLPLSVDSNERLLIASISGKDGGSED